METLNSSERTPGALEQGKADRSKATIEAP